MKLVNKNTSNIKVLGEIVPCNVGEHNLITIKTDQGATWYYRTLAELNEEWEDYEEPKESKESKEYWFINSSGETVSYYEEDEEPEDTEACKEIGNYFETEEEAEKAVEKLKTAKRLKDKGFRFDKWCNVSTGPYRPIWFYFEKDTALEDVKSDLDLLFGGEE